MFHQVIFSDANKDYIILGLILGHHLKVLWRTTYYKLKANTTQTSRISSVGICGKKSLPTKKHMKMKSSTMRSRSISNGGLGILISNSRYSLRIHIWRNWQKKKETKTLELTILLSHISTVTDELGLEIQTWYGFLTTPSPFSSNSPALFFAFPSQSAAICPIWPHKKHLSCCPGVNTT